MRLGYFYLLDLLLLVFLLFIQGCKSGNFAGSEDTGLEHAALGDSLPVEETDIPFSRVQENGAVSAFEPLLADEGILLALYVQDDRLMATDGESPEWLLTGDDGVSGIQIAPDGSKALFIYGDMELWVVNLDGEPDPRPLVTYEHLRKKKGWRENDDSPIDLWNRLLPRTCTWIDEGRKVAFNTVYYFESHAIYMNDLWVADVESGAVVELLPDDLGGVYAFSPDETRILVANPTAVAMVNADGENWQEILSCNFLAIYDSIFPPQPLWAEDGSYGLVLIPDREALPGKEDLPYDSWDLPRRGIVWKLPVDGVAEELTEVVWASLSEMYYGKVFSPDRSFLLHSEGNSLADSPLHFVTLDGTVIASHDGLEKLCGWSVDGHLIAKGDNTLILARSDGSREEFAIPGQVTNLILCKSLGPQTILISGRDANTFETNLWLVSPDREPRLIAESIDWQFDALLRQ